LIVLSAKKKFMQNATFSRKNVGYKKFSHSFLKTGIQSDIVKKEGH